jgi:hypothetical protein
MNDTSIDITPLEVLNMSEIKRFIQQHKAYKSRQFNNCKFLIVNFKQRYMVMAEAIKPDYDANAETYLGLKMAVVSK